ncbi:hypothetical protein M1D49_05915 [Bacillus sp. PK3-056]|uniref:hypothetical protein n=1 Tax=Niallia circulans TaxID=1397 RepID=UPI0013DE67CF|nr:hypothetical protein [Niallia circulans]
MNIKKTLVGTVVAASLFGTGNFVSANEINSVEENEVLSSLTEQQIADYNSLIADGYIVTVDVDPTTGYSSISGSKPAEKSPFSTRAVIGSDTFTVKSYVYYVKKYVDTISGKITVQYTGKTSTKVTSDTVTVRDGNNVSKSRTTSGSSAKLVLKFTEWVNASLTSAVNVPFTCTYTITNSGKISFFNDRAY